MSKGKTINLYNDTLQEVLSAAKRLAYSLKKEDLNADVREDFFNNARALDTLRAHLLCPTCCRQDLQDIVVNICGGTDAHGPKTDYKVGDRVQLVSISGIDQDKFLESNPSRWPYEVTLVCADQEAGDSFGHDLLVECRQHDSVYWVDFKNVQPA